MSGDTHLYKYIYLNLGYILFFSGRDDDDDVFMIIGGPTFIIIQLIQSFAYWRSRSSNVVDYSSLREVRTVNEQSVA